MIEEDNIDRGEFFTFRNPLTYLIDLVRAITISFLQSYCVNAQTALSLRWQHMLEYTLTWCDSSVEKTRLKTE